MVIQFESRHRNSHIIPRFGGHDAGRLLGTVDHYPASGASVRSLPWLG